jgi:hypothetical protein
MQQQRHAVAVMTRRQDNEHASSSNEKRKTLMRHGDGSRIGLCRGFTVTREIPGKQ